MATATMDDDKLTTEQAAEVIGVEPQTLQAWRCLGRYDLPYLKVGRAVRYSRRDLEQWLAGRRTTATTRSMGH